jgi:hypothetical protein
MNAAAIAHYSGNLVGYDRQAIVAYQTVSRLTQLPDVDRIGLLDVYA